jgi:ABC-2 type transport system permease protein
MRNIWLIARREYLERVRSKSFLIMTILIPALMVGLGYGSSIVNGKGGSERHVAVVSEDAQFGFDLQSELSGRKDMNITTDVYSPSPEMRTRLDLLLRSKGLDGYLWVTPASADHAQSFEWVPRLKNSAGLKNAIGDSVRAVQTREGLTHSGMGASDVKALTQSVDLDSSRAVKDEDSAAEGAYGLFFLMYFVILFYGMNVARSIIEEKTSRIFEVLLATISPEEMMAGKVIGVGAVGLSQVAIWVVAGLAIAGAGLFALPFHLTFVQIGFFIVYFLLGYILYSSVAAALGAMTSSEQELQQMNIFLMLPLIASSMVVYRVVTEPDGLIAKAFSFFPFCTPLIMYVRIAVKQPPWWEIAISIGELLVTIYVLLWVASRIYRVGVLMYGKRPNLPEILRWMKYS